MSTEKIYASNIKEFKDLMPQELCAGIKAGELRAIGSRYSDEPAGVILYNTVAKDQADLYYIYVEPEYRRLGVGTELIDATDCSYFDFVFEATDDRVTLEPFFAANDILTERVEYPFTELSVKKIKEEFVKNGVYRAKESGTFYDEMDNAKKQVVANWMQNEYGESLSGYALDKPKSIFSVKNGDTDSAVLLSEMNEDTLNLDYVYSKSKNSVEMVGMLRRIFEKALSDYGTETYIRMMPKMEEGMKLYNKLFGDVKDEIPVVYSVG